MIISILDLPPPFHPPFMDEDFLINTSIYKVFFKKSSSSTIQHYSPSAAQTTPAHLEITFFGLFPRIIPGVPGYFLVL